MVRRIYQIWDSEKTRKFQELLLGWYGRHRRELPWRNQPEPYRVWISEIMLQQTRVRTVLPYYEHFLKRFPDVETLARAPETDVLAAWAGLGYYRRARHLHRAARIILERHRGKFPAQREAIQELPGIGRYTAGAIQSIAFNQPQAIVDGNVRRVISRLHGIERRAEDGFFWRQAAAWIPSGRASDFNQAVMELGALVCIPATPLCLICPVQSLCLARRGGYQDRIPLPRGGRAAESARLVMLVLASNGQVLLRENPGIRYIPGDWGLPTCALQEHEDPERAAGRLARGILPEPVPLERRPPVRHGITFRRILIHVFLARLGESPRWSTGARRLKWVRLSELDRFLTSSAFRKALESALGSQNRNLVP